MAAIRACAASCFISCLQLYFEPYQRMAPTHALDGYSFACSRLKLPVDQDMVSSAKGTYAMTSGGGVWAVEVGGAGLRRHLRHDAPRRYPPLGAVTGCNVAFSYSDTEAFLRLPETRNAAVCTRRIQLFCFPHEVLSLQSWRLIRALEPSRGLPRAQGETPPSLANGETSLEAV